MICRRDISNFKTNDSKQKINYVDLQKPELLDFLTMLLAPATCLCGEPLQKHRTSSCIVVLVPNICKWHYQMNLLLCDIASFQETVAALLGVKLMTIILGVKLITIILGVNTVAALLGVKIKIQ